LLLLDALGVLVMRLRHRPEPLPHKTQTKVVEKTPNCLENLVQVCLSPALVTAVADEAAVTRARWHKTRAAKDTADNPTERVLEAPVHPIAALAALAAPLQLLDL